MGEAADPKVQDAILKIAAGDKAVQAANGVVTVHIGPNQVVATLSVEFEDSAKAPDIEACVMRIESAVRADLPQVTGLFIKPQTSATWTASRQALENGEARTVQPV